MEASKTKIGGILHVRGLLLFGLVAGPDRPGLAAGIFCALGEAHVNVQFIVQSVDPDNVAHMQFCADASDEGRVREVLAGTIGRLGAAPRGSARTGAVRRVALLSVFGPDFRERPGIAGEAFGALAAAGINILAVSTSISTISCVVDEAVCEEALRTLHGTFALP